MAGGCGIAEFADAAGTASNGTPVAELQKLYVTPKAQGHGLGRRLIAEAEHFARTAGYERLYLETHHNLQTAARLYRTLGWRELSAPLPGSLHSTMDIFMIKQL